MKKLACHICQFPPKHSIFSLQTRKKQLSPLHSLKNCGNLTCLGGLPWKSLSSVCFSTTSVLSSYSQSVQIKKLLASGPFCVRDVGLCTVQMHQMWFIMKPACLPVVSLIRGPELSWHLFQASYFLVLGENNQIIAYIVVVFQCMT